MLIRKTVGVDNGVWVVGALFAQPLSKTSEINQIEAARPLHLERKTSLCAMKILNVSCFRRLGLFGTPEA